MRIRIDLEENPSGTHQQRGVSVQRGHAHFYEKANVRALRQLYHHKIWRYMYERKMAAPHFEGPVRLDVTFCFSIKKRSLWGLPKDTRPDADNICKLLLDVLTDLEFWKDDGQVACLIIKKFYSEHPSIKISVGPYIALHSEED